MTSLKCDAAFKTTELISYPESHNMITIQYWCNASPLSWGMLNWSHYVSFLCLFVAMKTEFCTRLMFPPCVTVILTSHFTLTVRELYILIGIIKKRKQHLSLDSGLNQPNSNSWVHGNSGNSESQFTKNCSTKVLPGEKNKTLILQPALRRLGVATHKQLFPSLFAINTQFWS